MPTEHTQDIDKHFAQILDEAAQPVTPQSRERALGEMAECRAAARVPGAVARPKRMRRLAFAGIAMLAVALATVLVIPRGGDRRDVQAILAGVAHAMQEAQSVYFVCLAGGPNGQLGFEHHYWISAQAFYHWHHTPYGTLERAEVFDAGTGEWWQYDPEKKILYVADLKPIEAKAREVIVKACGRRSLYSGIMKLIFVGNLEDYPASVTSSMRDGREVYVINFGNAWTLEVDAATHHLLTMWEYSLIEGQPEVVKTIDSVAYDVPLPAGIAELRTMRGTKIEKAVGVIVKREDTVGLHIQVGDQVVAALVVPREAASVVPRE